MPGAPGADADPAAGRPVRSPGPRRGAFRVPAVLAAVLVAAWFGLSLVQERAAATAADLIADRSTTQAGPAQDADRLLDRAAALNPDRGIDLLRARLQADQRDRGAASATLQRVVAAEPDNLVAWLQLALTVKDLDPGLYERAVAEGRRLNPRPGG